MFEPGLWESGSRGLTTTLQDPAAHARRRSDVQRRRTAVHVLSSHFYAHAYGARHAHGPCHADTRRARRTSGLPSSA